MPAFADTVAWYFSTNGRALLIVCPLIFMGALVDSIAGGGGVITLPAYYLAGLPVHMAMGTNKLSSGIFTTVSVARFWRGGEIYLPTAIAAGAAALGGSALGSRLALLVSERALQWVLVFLLPAAGIFILTKGKVNDVPARRDIPQGRAVVLSVGVGFLVGGYDGFFGPGTGTIAILAFVFLTGHSLKTAMGNAKVVNLASNIAALATLGSSGKVVFAVGIPAALCGIAGSYLGSGLALRKGARVFRPIMAVMMVLLVLSLLYDLLAR